MSRIVADAMFSDTPFQVVIGWDRPLQHCFLQFDLDDDKFDDPRFEKLHDASMITAFQPLTVEDIRDALGISGVTICPGALAELAAHCEQNAGNVFVRFDLQGNRTQV